MANQYGETGTLHFRGIDLPACRMRHYVHPDGERQRPICRFNGFDTLRADISGELKNGVKLHYPGTAINTGRKLIWLVAWCDEWRFAANRSELEKLATGLRL